MAADKTYSLRELAEETGLSARTIRAYIADGLVRGPESRGRHARYTEYHLNRLRTIQELKDYYGLPLAEIRRYLLMARDDEDIRLVGIGHDDVACAFEAPPEPRAAADEETVYAERAFAFPGDEEQLAKSCRSEVRGRRNPPLESLVHLLRQRMDDRRIPRQARAEPVQEIEVTPEFSLRVRGEFTRDELALFEQLADALREALLGGLD